MRIVYLDGAYVPAEQARISPDDRGFLFGDGAYEATRAVEGRLFELERHLARLRRTLHGLRIALPDAEIDALAEVHQRLLRENELETGEALVYLQVTRGAAPRAHAFPPAATRPTVYLFASAITPPHALRERGAAAVTYPDVRWARCDLKTVNLLPNVLAKQHAVEQDAAEAIFVRDGVVMEGAQTNVFVVIDGELRTHPSSPYILGGVTREVVLELARGLALPVREVPVLLDELPRASELFLTSTTTDVLPLVRLDGRQIGDGRPGPVARRLYEALRGRLTE